jgi:hypothetical protein
MSKKQKSLTFAAPAEQDIVAEAKTDVIVASGVGALKPNGTVQLAVDDVYIYIANMRAIQN